MLSQEKNRFSALEIDFSNQVQDRFGESIVTEGFHPMAEEMQALQNCFEEAEKDQIQIQKLLRELRSIK